MLCMVPTDGLTLVSTPPFPPFPPFIPTLSVEHDVDRRCRQIFNERRRTAEASLPSLRHVPRFHWVRRAHYETRKQSCSVDSIDGPLLFFDAVQSMPPFQTDVCSFLRYYICSSYLPHVHSTMARSLDSYDSFIHVLLICFCLICLPLHFAAAAPPCYLSYCCSCFAGH